VVDDDENALAIEQQSADRKKMTVMNFMMMMMMMPMNLLSLLDVPTLPIDVLK
jgi:hypothetical protein